MSVLRDNADTDKKVNERWLRFFKREFYRVAICGFYSFKDIKVKKRAAFSRGVKGVDYVFCCQRFAVRELYVST